MKKLSEVVESYLDHKRIEPPCPNAYDFNHEADLTKLCALHKVLTIGCQLRVHGVKENQETPKK